MNAKTLIDNLHRRGVRLRIDGEGLRWFGPVGVMTETDLSTLRRHKAEALRWASGLPVASYACDIRYVAVRAGGQSKNESAIALRSSRLRDFARRLH